MSKNLLDILKEDSVKDHEYEDERLISNIYLCSLSTSHRELARIAELLKGITDEKKQEDYEDKVNSNDWLLNRNIRIKDVNSINFDKIPEAAQIDNSQSADALIIDYNNKKCFLIEFKNCSKSTLIDNYIDGKDSVIVKYKNSKNIIKSINVDGFDSESIISQTEVALVYNKNDSAGSVTTSFPAKRITTKDSNNKQSRATTKRNKIGSACKYKFEMGSTKKRTEDSLNSFRKKVKALGFSSCCLLDRKQTNVAILGADDFSDLINKGIFEQIDWGIYKSFWAPQ